MTPKERLNALLTGGRVDRPLVDIGTSTLTALRPGTRPAASDGRVYSDTVMHLPILSEAELTDIGAQSARWGATFRGATLDENDAFRDRYGNNWIWADGEPAPLEHALGEADLGQVSSWMPPNLAGVASLEHFPAAEDKVVVVDAPTPGILDMSFRLRGYYELLLDTTDRWPIANALFDKALSSILRDYEAVLRRVPAGPDLVVYGDDLAFQNDLYLSEERFTFFLRPRMSRIFSKIRSLTSAEILFHSCGASLPVLRDVVDLGVRIVNFEPTARGMSLSAVRKALGPDIVFHGVVDFRGLADALAKADRPGIAYHAEDLLVGWPMIVAPSDNLAGDFSRDSLREVTRFLAAIDMPQLLAGHSTEAIDEALRYVEERREGATSLVR